MWHKVADSESALRFNNEGICSVQIDDNHLCLIKFAGNLFACKSTCPHGGANLGDGFVNSRGQIICPLHGYKFQLQNGHNVTGEGYKLKVYKAEVRESGVYIDL